MELLKQLLAMKQVNESANSDWKEGFQTLDSWTSLDPNSPVIDIKDMDQHELEDFQEQAEKDGMQHWLYAAASLLGLKTVGEMVSMESEEPEWGENNIDEVIQNAKKIDSSLAKQYSKLTQMYIELLEIDGIECVNAGTAGYDALIARKSDIQ